MNRFFDSLTNKFFDLNGWVLGGIVAAILAILCYFAYQDAVWWASYKVQHNCHATGQQTVTFIPSTTCANNSCTTVLIPVFSYEFKCDNGYIWR